MSNTVEFKCAIATDSTLQGNPAQALPGLAAKTFKDGQDILEQTYGSTLNPMESYLDITSLMQQAGRGAQGIVIGDKVGDPYSHAFNVVNQFGAVRYIDGQIGGGVKNIGQYDYFWFIKTK